jgi:hypothetical protein
MKNSISAHSQRGDAIGRTKLTGFWVAILSILGLCTWAGAARANCNDGSAAVIGQLPDLIFLTGQSSTVQSLDVQYTGVPGGQNCRIDIHSDIPGVGLGVNSDSNSPPIKHGDLHFGDVTTDEISNHEIGASVCWPLASPEVPSTRCDSLDRPSNPLSHLIYTLDVGVTEASLANVTKVPQHGVIEIWQWTTDFGEPEQIGAINVYIIDANNQFPLTFPITATISNTECLEPTTDSICRRNSVWFDNPFTNGNPSARVLVTQNWNPNGVAGHFNPHNIGVWYDGKRWRIFNQDGAAMPFGASFNVRIEGNAPPVVAPASSSSRVYIDDAAANSNPYAVVLATARLNSQVSRFGSSMGVYNPHPIGVDYDSQKKRWFIFNEDFAPINAYASFNVKIYGHEDASFKVNMGHTFQRIVDVKTGVSIVQDARRNVDHNFMLIDTWFSKGHPSANAFITHNASQSALNAHPTGVAYDVGIRRWIVFNEDQAIMRDDAAFNVVVPLAPLYGEPN